MENKIAAAIERKGKEMKAKHNERNLPMITIPARSIPYHNVS